MASLVQGPDRCDDCLRRHGRFREEVLHRRGDCEVTTIERPLAIRRRPRPCDGDARSTSPPRRRSSSRSSSLPLSARTTPCESALLVAARAGIAAGLKLFRNQIRDDAARAQISAVGSPTAATRVPGQRARVLPFREEALEVELDSVHRCEHQEVVPRSMSGRAIQRRWRRDLDGRKLHTFATDRRTAAPAAKPVRERASPPPASRTAASSRTVDHLVHPQDFATTIAGAGSFSPQRANSIVRSVPVTVR